MHINDINDILENMLPRSRLRLNISQYFRILQPCSQVARFIGGLPTAGKEPDNSCAYDTAVRGFLLAIQNLLYTTFANCRRDVLKSCKIAGSDSAYGCHLPS
jgi:hypothetical protein